ncbi:MAG: class I SAM-dependent methyltransferase, partial [Saprospiraceae bacterium]
RPTQSNESQFEQLMADYEGADRVIWQKPELVLDLLGDLENKTVADIGAGHGYFSFRLARRSSKVLAIEIDAGMLQFIDSIQSLMGERMKAQIETRLTDPNDPGLRESEADAVLIVNTYAYLERRLEYLTRLLAGMKPGGKLLIIDFKRNSAPYISHDTPTAPLRQVVGELEQAGFVIEKADNQTLDYQYIVTAVKPR